MKKIKQFIGILLAMIALAAALLFGIGGIIAVAGFSVLAAIGVYAGSRYFLGHENKIRTAWAVDVGELLGKDTENQLDVHKAQVDSTLSVLHLVPFAIHEEGFTYYDTTVQNQIAAALEHAKSNKPESGWTAETPLAILSPFGTGGNDLYLYFETLFPTQVTYTIHVDDAKIPDYTVTASNGIGAEKYAKTHEFLMIGLVPGYTNHVTMTMIGSHGKTRRIVTFDITLPEPRSKYPVILEHTDGESTAPMTDGLFSMMRTDGYMGYSFFFDNNGIMRHEMILEGFGTDRYLYVENDIITCVSVSKLARINPLGKVERTYPLDGYHLHHDICLAQEGKVMALVTKLESKTVEDVLIEVDLSTGAVTELLDFSVFMHDYVQNFSRPISVTDDFFWWIGKWDWLHLNTLQYSEQEDCIMVSSRETSTIIKIKNIHTAPAIDWFIGNPAFWEGTGYEKYCLTKRGDFVYQYGQHTVEYHDTKEKNGVYYLRTYNNNFWSLNSRDFDLEVERTVSRSLSGEPDDLSWVYIYEIDETAGTFSLHDAFAVPYSSIVSNAQPFGSTGNWIVNSGAGKVFGEYDASGKLIRQFQFICNMNGYRTFKFQTNGFWFQAS